MTMTWRAPDSTDARLRRRLSRLACGHVDGAAPGGADATADRAAGAPVHHPVALDELLGGREVTSAHGGVFVHELTRDARDRGMLRLLAVLREAANRLHVLSDDALGPEYAAVRDLGLARAVFLDLETGGLAGQPVFLAGLLRVTPAALEIRQVLVRSYAEEAALLEVVRDAIGQAPLIVTYNGKSFDVPMLVDRAAYHGLPFELAGRHLDLLHAARRRYRGRYPDCRLTTLEWYVCHRRRSGDVPGADIPGRFHRYLRDGDPTPLVPILHHNVLDLVTLAELFAHLAPEPAGPRFVPDWDTIRAELDASA